MTLTTRAKAKTLASAASSAVLLASLPALALAQQSTLRVVPHSDRKIVDPIWTPA